MCSIGQVPSHMILAHILWRNTLVLVWRILAALTLSCASPHTNVNLLHTQPDNILVQVCRDQDTLKLFDMGAARLIGEGLLQQKYEPTMDIRYTAPEVFQQGARGPATDIWWVLVNSVGPGPNGSCKAGFGALMCSWYTPVGSKYCVHPISWSLLIVSHNCIHTFTKVNTPFKFLLSLHYWFSYLCHSTHNLPATHIPN